MNRLTQLSILVFMIAVIVFGRFQYMSGQITDRSAPEISMDSEEITVSVNDTEEALLQGVTAYDSTDGDVTDSLVVEDLSTFLSFGRRLVKYGAFDHNMHVANASRTVIYSDYYSPEFTLEAPLSFPIETNSFMENIFAYDCLDGDVTDFIKMTPLETIQEGAAGDYKVQFQVSNSAGDVSSFEAYLHMYDPSVNNGPQVKLDRYLVYLNQGDAFDPSEYPVSVTIGGKKYDIVDGSGNYGAEEINPEDEIVVGIDQLEIDDEVDTDSPGTYRVRYSMTNAAEYEKDRYTGTVTMYVIVRKNARQ